MLMTEFNLEDAIEVRAEEKFEEKIEEIVRNAFAKGLPVDVIRDITGLDMDTIKTLSTVQNV